MQMIWCCTSSDVVAMLKIKPILIFLAIILLIAGGFWFLGKGNTNPNTESATPDDVMVTPTSNTLNPDTVIAEKEKIDPSDSNVKVNEELETVTFCGKTYKSKQILVKNVDVMKRLAELAAPQKTDMQKHLCSVPSETQVDGVITVNIKNAVLGPGDQKEPMQIVEGLYVVALGPGQGGPYVFGIDVNRNVIGEAGFTGVEVGPLIK